MSSFNNNQSQQNYNPQMSTTTFSLLHQQGFSALNGTQNNQSLLSKNLSYNLSQKSSNSLNQTVYQNGLTSKPFNGYFEQKELNFGGFSKPVVKTLEMTIPKKNTTNTWNVQSLREKNRMKKKKFNPSFVGKGTSMLAKLKKREEMKILNPEQELEATLPSFNCNHSSSVKSLRPNLFPFDTQNMSLFGKKPFFVHIDPQSKNEMNQSKAGQSGRQSLFNFTDSKKPEMGLNPLPFPSFLKKRDSYDQGSQMDAYSNINSKSESSQVASNHLSILPQKLAPLKVGFFCVECSRKKILN